MPRIAIYKEAAGENGEPAWELDGWFEQSKAEVWPGMSMEGRRVDLVRTSNGHWLKGNMSGWDRETDRFVRTSPEEALAWLMDGYHDEVIARHFGDVGEERGPGRPTTGTRIDVRLHDDLLARLDTERERAGDPSRAETIRRMLAAGLDNKI